MNFPALILVVGLLFVRSISAAEIYTITPEPGWASPLTCEAPESVPESEIENGVYYFLIDRFTRVATSENYGHFARMIVNEAGIQNGSEISIIVDPSYETLELHKVDVLRDGRWEQRLSPAIVSVLQRETQMENFVLDGRYTVVIQIPDVRKGDVICYSFTRTGSNPVMAGHFYLSFDLGYHSPQHIMRQRVESDPDRPFKIRQHGTTLEPKVTGRISEWLAIDTPLIRQENGVPHWVITHRWIELSDMAAWANVVDWAVPLYDFDQPLTAELEEKISGIAELPTAEEQAAAALRLVQEEVRYLGVETGVNSHQPRPASEVFTKRYGDCKEKVALLGAVLRRLGIESHPVLVNSQFLKTVRTFLPSPYAFDHVISEIVIGGKSWFVDPTRSHQRGPLEQIFVPAFGYGLRVRPGETELCKVEPIPASLGTTRVIQDYHVSDPENSTPSRMEITTTFTGQHAEDIRASLAGSSQRARQDAYLEFYARDFPGIESTAPLTYVDDPKSNVLTMRESYLIPALWKDNPKQPGQRVAEIRQPELENQLTWPAQNQRLWPFQLPWPRHYSLRANIHLPEDWPDDETATRIRNPWFDFAYVTRTTGNRVEIEGHYRALASMVPAHEAATYSADAKRAWESVWYPLTFNTGTASVFSWGVSALMIVTAAATLILSALGLWLFCRRGANDPPPLPPPPEDHHLIGLGGWLILVGIGVVVSPLALSVVAVQEMGSFLNPRTWDGFAGSDVSVSTLLPIATAAGLIAAVCGFLVISFALVFLFFRRSRRFPGLFIIVTIVEALMTLGLFFVELSAAERSAAAEVFKSHVGDVVRSIIGAAIWIPYMLVSRRVKATFRR